MGKVGWFGRVATHNLDYLACLHNSWDFITGQNHRNLPIRPNHPLGKLSLGMGIGAINLVQHKTHGCLVSSYEGRNTS